MKDCPILPVIIVYNPDIRLLIRNIESLLEYFDKIHIWENSKIESEYFFEHFGNRIEIHGINKNVGISKALNLCLEYAEDWGYNYLLIMDQDSILSNCRLYVETSLNILNNEYCIIGPQVNSDIVDNRLIESTYIINSGSIVPIHLAKLIGGYYEDFFVDAIDTEMCTRVKYFGYRVLINPNGHLKQRFGEQTIHHFLSKTIVSYNYSPIRLYEIFRNHIILARMYGWSWFRFRLLLAYAKKLIPGIFYELNRLNKIKCIFKGIFRGLVDKITIPTAQIQVGTSKLEK
jgi:rhamnosyltransferase